MLKAATDYYAELSRLWSMFMGYSIHAQFEPYGKMSEVKLWMPLQVPVTIDGESRVVEFPVSGTLDSYDPKHRRLIDYKTTSREFYWTDRRTGERVHRELPQPEHVIQANIYRMLLEYYNHPVDEIYIWYVRMVPGAPRKMVQVPIWDEETTYLKAVELATPLVRSRETGELPPCTCIYKSGLDPDLCQEVTEADFARVEEFEIPDEEVAA